MLSRLAVVSAVRVKCGLVFVKLGNGNPSNFNAVCSFSCQFLTSLFNLPVKALDNFRYHLITYMCNKLSFKLLLIGATFKHPN